MVYFVQYLQFFRIYNLYPDTKALEEFSADERSIAGKTVALFDGVFGAALDIPAPDKETDEPEKNTGKPV